MRCVFAAVCLVTGILLSCAHNVAAQDRETKVRQDRERFKNDDRWIYNRLDWGIEEARESGKPLLIIFRCIPCEACSHFDQKVIEEQEGISDLLDKFVCVRIVQANGMDLNRFQFDYDQSFHAVLMNADQVIYGRFGTRSARPEEEDMTLDGFRAAMEKALAWHAEFPNNRDLFGAKNKPEGFVGVPEEFPSLKGKYDSTLDYEGNVVQSCIHCHQIRDAQRLTYRDRDEVIPDHILFPYPLPDVLGLRMDPRASAKVTEVQTESLGAKAGLKAGDEIQFMEGQPILSVADLQWVLHTADDHGRIELVVQRGDEQKRLALVLPAGWRQSCDISWRPTTWDLRRMVTGGLVLKDANDEQRESANLGDDRLALVVDYVGEYGEHAVGKNAGFRKGDIIVNVDGKNSRMTEGQLMHYALSLDRGANLKFTVLRAGKRMQFSYRTQ